jgi:hypothetical protein
VAGREEHLRRFLVSNTGRARVLFASVRKRCWRRANPKGMRVTIRKDDDVSKASESSEVSQDDASTRSRLDLLQPPSETLSSSSDIWSSESPFSLESFIEEQRAADLDALADALLSREMVREPPPKTLVGLGVPQGRGSDPGELEGAPEHDLAGAPQEAVEAPTAEEAEPMALASTQAHPAPDESQEPAAPLTPRSDCATITPPPGDGDAAATSLHDLLDINSDALATQVLTRPRAATYSARPFVDKSLDTDSLEPRSSGVRSDAPWAISSQRRAEPALGSRLALIGLAFAASLAATIALVNSLLPARKGTLLITASGPNQVRIEQAEVLFDGKKVCSEVPCRLEGLSAGVHGVSVWAKGYEHMAAQPFEIRGGVESALQLMLTRRDTAALRVNVNVPGLSVRVDGEDRGAAPTTIHQLSPTEHTVRLAGNPAYAPYEQRVTLEADRVLTLEPKLVALIGKLHLEPGAGADSARIEVIRDGFVREVGKLPTDLELTPGRSYRVHASRKNFEDYDAEVAFDEARTEQSLVVSLTPRESALRAAPVVPQPAPAGQAPASSARASGALNINSIPISQVLLDGLPIGSTPLKLNLNAGPHALIFVHPTLGRQTLNVNVPAGQTAVAAVRF